VWTSNGPQGVWPNCFLVDPTNPSTLYLGTHGDGVFKSTDGGGTWVGASAGLNSNSMPGSPLSVIRSKGPPSTGSSQKHSPH
jgi:hypothetical protein